MKIAVCGAHKVGKTTLIDKIHESLPEYECMQEPYYDLEETGYLFSDVPTPDDFLAQLEHSIKQITTPEDNVIFDRCPVDLLAYTQVTNAFDDINIQTWFQRVQDVMGEIDLLVFVPVEEPDLIDCPEADLPELRHQVNELLTEWIWDFDTDVIKVTGSLLARKNQVLRYLSKT